MADLKTTYQDDVLDVSVNEKRKYNIIQNADGTVSFEDVTVYSQVGDSFGSSDVNEITGAINGLNNNMVSNIYVGEDGKLHKVQGGADSVLPFNSGAKLVWSNPDDTKSFPAQTIDIGVNPLDYDFVMLKVRRGVSDGHTDIYAFDLSEGTSFNFWGSALNNYYRNITITNSGINFTLCNNGSPNYVIPCEIWVV